MSSAVFVIPSRFVVSPPIAGYLPPPYGTRRGALLIDFLRGTGRSPDMPNAHVLRRWQERDGIGEVLAASAFGTDNNAWSVIGPRRVHRPYRAIALACCQMLIGACIAVSMLSILRADSAIWHPVAWFDRHESARSADAPSIAIRRAPMQLVLQTAGTVSASEAARSVPADHVAPAAPAAPAATHVERGAGPAPASMAHRALHRTHPVRSPSARKSVKPAAVVAVESGKPASIAAATHSRPAPDMAAKYDKPVRILSAKYDKPAPIVPVKQGKSAPMHRTRPHEAMSVNTHRPPSSVERVRKGDDWVSDDAMRALRDELARHDAAARMRAVASARVPANAIFLLHDQVRLTER